MNLAVGIGLRDLSRTFPQMAFMRLSLSINVENDHIKVSDKYVTGFTI